MTKDKIIFPLIIPPSEKPLLMFSAIGAAYIVSYLKEKGIDVVFIDSDKITDEREYIKDIILETDPEFVGFSVNIKNRYNAFDLCDFVKSISPKVKTVIGGHPPSVNPDEYAEKFDYIVRGDGEIPLYQLLIGQNPAEIKGVFSKRKDVVIDNHINYDPVNLEELSFPDIDVLGLKQNKSVLSKFFNLDVYPTFVTRGCGGQCIFCTGKEFNKKHRIRDVNNVLKEMRLAKYTYGAKEVLFQDPSFTYNMEYTKELCRVFIENREDILPWRTGTRMDKIDKELVALMKKAGCIGLGFGLETADEKIMRVIKKTYDPKKAEEIIKYCDREGFYTFTTIMYGVYGETKETLKKTLNMTLSLPFDMAFYGIFEINESIVGKYTEPEEKMECSARYVKWFLIYSYFRFYVRPLFIKRLIFRSINRKKAIFMFVFIVSMTLNLRKVPVVCSVLWDKLKRLVQK